MKDITILIPLTEPSTGMSDIQTNYMNECIININNCSQYYDGKLLMKFIFPEKDSSYDNTISDDPEIEYLHNYGETDYCSQINFGVEHVETEYFAIMEMDDKFNPKWFKMFNDYLPCHEDVGIFLPINVIHNVKTNEREFVNDMVWAASFSNEIGYIDYECLQHAASFNLTGGIFKTSEWIGYKPSIKLAFNYEYLLRATNNDKTKVFVIPKEGYYHQLFRPNSLIEQYNNEIPMEETSLWFELAKREHIYSEDRKQSINALNKKENDILT
jgi:hypothetical protein